MKKQSREFLFVVAMFTLLSVYGNHAHLFYAITHGVWWYLGFYASTYVLSIVTIAALAFTLTKLSKKKKKQTTEA